MNAKDACDVIEYARAFQEERTPLITALDVAIEALEKQIPLKPLETQKAFLCSNCGQEITERQHNPLQWPYCKKCGQIIDWSESEVKHG